ncbi:M15 family metallopeptidase [Paenibacillus alginolyticus]|uniref:M15 family metallopeptidase n=1 Tax=Paenibacillus alginolyticus TaxID=59839 RepID=A0ABT4G715_9BACL|nr:M15 family metallopeptidase [Paenibacillus alginolyticus]MCY9663609.1 M15 family metallopeptidase [Paenibacillus alginolyticus]MCY9691967.1 M15 family metallopeptidase [Paenibacillus alginolyticus]MEC0144157.1 M15 family metallopeptidase [Paenibacillus alginolyticus]
MNNKMTYSLAIFVALSIASGCSKGEVAPSVSPAATATPPVSAGSPTPSPSPSPSPSITPKPSNTPTASPSTSAVPPKSGAIQVVAKPESITVLVNKQNSLPSSYEPTDLVYPDIPFTFAEKNEKRKMRKDAASAIEKLFAGADKDGIHLAGVSAYRSYATQKSIFQRYVLKDGEEKAKMYSAVPGTSEHETGLAIDVTGSDGKCAAEDCFGGTKEAKWLEAHAAEYGFIIRYPKGKSSITGYQYEPWHIRYVGIDVSKELAAKGLTMEEYYNAVPVTK